MNEETEDELYHLDFTTASDWEVFICRLEEVIREWKLPQVKRGPVLPKGKLSSSWDKKSEKIPFADVEFNITRYNLKLTQEEDVISPLEEEFEEGRSQALEDMMSLDNDFPPQKVWDLGDGSPTLHPHPLAVLYGLRDFVVLSPIRGVVITTESRVKILLSSIYIAINNTNCSVPVFVQIHDPAQHYYMGVCEGRGIRTEFEMVHLKRTPPYCKYLTGLLDVFKSKVASPLPLEPVTVSVQFTYILRDWTSNTWTQQPPDFDFLQGETLGVTELGKLPFGATFDPVSELHLFATWPKLVDSSVVDGESYSDLEPSQAPEWSVRVKMAEQPACLLSEYLNEFIQLCGNGRTMHDLLGDMVDQNNAGNMSSSLNILTESRVPSLSRVIRRSKQRRESVNRDGPIVKELLMPILYFLFPDAEPNSATPYPETFGNNANGDSRPTEEQLTGLKTAPEDSLVWRLAVVMSHVVYTLGGVKSAAHLWYEFCGEMRYRWENCTLITGVPPGFPDPRMCLLHQKLQMLNCCIERRLARESMARAGSMEADESESDSEDDEFFDCSADVPGDGSDEGNRPRRRHRHSLWNQPTGRYAKHGNLRLLKTGEHLYIPITQV